MTRKFLNFEKDKTSDLLDGRKDPCEISIGFVEIASGENTIPHSQDLAYNAAPDRVGVVVVGRQRGCAKTPNETVTAPM